MQFKTNSSFENSSNWFPVNISGNTVVQLGGVRIKNKKSMHKNILNNDAKLTTTHLNAAKDV